MSDKIFLKILKAALHGEEFESTEVLSDEDVRKVFELASIHRVLPLILDRGYALVEDEEMLSDLRRQSKLEVSCQALRTQSFLELYSNLCDSGFEPLVIKGFVCRSLYPFPDLRPSADEDLYVPSAQYSDCAKKLLELGFVNAGAYDENHYENTFVNNDGFCVELHKALFPLSKDYYKKHNCLFEKAFDNAVCVSTENTCVRTLSATDHLLYLFLHSLKHFVRSGVGIRQVCDITLFIKAYAKDIDPGIVMQALESIGAEKYAQGILAICVNFLGLDADCAKAFGYTGSAEGFETHLLEDILSAGIYGNADRGRMHSASVTLKAVQGKKETLWRKAFPAAEAFDSRYAYGAKHRILVPVAWVHRWFDYLKEASVKTGNTPKNSMQIGDRRVKLLSEYGLLK